MIAPLQLPRLSSRRQRKDRKTPSCRDFDPALAAEKHDKSSCFDARGSISGGSESRCLATGAPLCIVVYAMSVPAPGPFAGPVWVDNRADLGCGAVPGQSSKGCVPRASQSRSVGCRLFSRHRSDNVPRGRGVCRQSLVLLFLGGMRKAPMLPHLALPILQSQSCTSELNPS